MKLFGKKGLYLFVALILIVVGIVVSYFYNFTGSDGFETDSLFFKVSVIKGEIVKPITVSNLRLGKNKFLINVRGLRGISVDKNEFYLEGNSEE